MSDPMTNLEKNLPAESSSASLPDVARPSLFGPVSALDDAPENPPIERWQRLGALIIICGLGGFLLWASTFQLSGGAYATGMVRLSDEKQSVAHMEGGVIRRLNVAEGDKVTAGQELVMLDDYNSETDLAILEKRRFEMMARKARLEAVRDGLEQIIFPVELVNAKGNELVDEVVSAQERQFKADRTEIDGQKNILQQQNAQYQSIIQSLEIQLESGRRQIELIAEEVAGVEKLLARGLERKPRLLALKRQQAALESQNAEYAGQVSSYREKISETELKIVSLDSGKRAEAVAELAELQANLTQTDEQWRNARLRSKELTLRANFDGTVINLNYRNVGAVVTPGQPIMEIVPSSKIFVVDAKLMPTDIDVVHEGLPASIRLSGLKQRTHVNINGHVTRVSPDAKLDERSGTSYFEVRASFDPADREFKKLQERGELYAGMPADVIAISHKRTMLQYLMQPLSDNFARSFHEE